MKSVLVLCAILAAGPALAQRRPDSRAMTCAGIHATIASAGGIVMSTGPRTYDRYVAHRGFCTPSEMTTVRFIPARDTPACQVLICEEFRPFEDR